MRVTKLICYLNPPAPRLEKPLAVNMHQKCSDGLVGVNKA